MVNFATKIKTLRTGRNLTQKQLADMIGVAVSAISAYESGSRFPSYEGLISLARIFHVSTDYLLGVDSLHTIDATGLSEIEAQTIVQLIELLKDSK